MEKSVIRLSLGDWIWNSAVAGFVNIVGLENVNFEKNTAIISTNCLDNFEEKYFSYFINTYEKNLSWYKIVSFKKNIEHYQEDNFETLNLQGLKSINNYIMDVVKKFINSNSYKAAFELMGNEEHIKILEKRLKKIKEPKDEAAFVKDKNSFIEEVKSQCEILNEIIEYCGTGKGRRFIGAKNVVYSIIKNGWDGVCFLNPQTKIKDIYEDYNTHFVEEAKEYIKTAKDKYKYCCFNCKASIKNLNNDLSFINLAGFDTARKPSHVWNFNNDVAICPLCKLIYSCIPAGFVYSGNTGLYINANVNIKHNIDINNRVKNYVFNEIKDDFSSRKIYRVLLQALKKQQLEREKYELVDVQIVRYENDSYKFNLLPQPIIRLINKFEKEIEGIILTGYKEGKERFNIYEQVLEQIFNNQNLFLLINKLLHYKISRPTDCFFHTGHIMNILKINTKLIKNLGGMGNMGKERDYLKEAKGAGYYLREAYLKRDPKTGKIPGISYRLLNALKTNNRNIFMDVLLNCYLYVGKEVPNIISEVLRDDDEIFGTIGYAFVSGFIDGKEDKNEMHESKEENSNG